MKEEKQEKPKLQFQMDDKLIQAAFEEARLRSETRANDPNRVDIPEDQQELDVGDHNYMMDESDVEAHQKRTMGKMLGRHK